MDNKEIEGIILKKIYPFTLNERGQADISQLVRQYPNDLLLECIDIGVSSYFRYDEQGNLTQGSVNNFLNKLGGIAFNKTRSPIEQEILRIKNIGRNAFTYWDISRAETMLRDYVNALKNAGWDENRILTDLKTEVVQLINKSYNWSQWLDTMSDWLDDIVNWDTTDAETVKQNGTIIPYAVMTDTPIYLQKIIRQINASYENNLFDCCAVMMRRLLEVLLVLTYQKMNVEYEIMDKSGLRHMTLDRIIQNAEQNPTLALSANTRKDMKLFKDLGNFSAHKIWYSCTQQDINPHLIKYRVIIEELIYKAGMK